MTASKWKGASNDSAWERSWRSHPVKMNCKGKRSSSTRRWILPLKPPRLRPRPCLAGAPFFGTACCAHTGASSCTVGHDRCHVWVLGEKFEHVGPDTVLFPARVALDNVVPLAKVGWQFTPPCAGAQNPANCFDETATFFFLPGKGTRLSLQKRVQLLPLMVGNPNCRLLALVGTLQNPANVNETTIYLGYSIGEPVNDGTYPACAASPM